MIEYWVEGDSVTLYHRLTGRHIELGTQTLARIDEPQMAPVRARLEREFFRGPRPDVGALIPCRSHRVLLLPDGLWVPVPSQPTPGGYAYRSLALDDDERALWLGFNDSRPLATVAHRAGVSPVRAVEFCLTLTDPQVQALQLRAAPPHPRDASLAHLFAPARPANARTPDQHGDQGQTTLSTYHLESVTDGATHFDDRETTVAHALAMPHPALGGRRFGAALRSALAARGWVKGQVVEVGCGTGEMARDFAWPDYLRIDLSPELLRTQASNAPATPGVLGDATRLPLRDASVDLLVNNEVIADLSAGPPQLPSVAERLERYAIPRGDALYNVGAWMLVEEVSRVLKPGGGAYISEFGDPDRAPEEATQLDHPEVSIHFGHLQRVAQALGLQTDLVRLDDLLGLDPSARQLARISHEALRARARSEGWHLPARAWTPEQLEAVVPWPVEGLRWVPMTDEGPGPLITRFYALLLHKPLPGV